MIQIITAIVQNYQKRNVPNKIEKITMAPHTYTNGMQTSHPITFHLLLFNYAYTAYSGTSTTAVTMSQ